jgi:hypothetical protein
VTSAHHAYNPGVRYRAWIELAFGAALVLPPLGTESRSRAFCSEWLRLTTAEKHGVVVAAEGRESGEATSAACRAGLRGAVRHKLDVECRNWSQLMDFEIRAIIDGVLQRCQARE